MSTERLNIAMLSVHSCPLGKLGSRDTGGMSVYVRELAAELGRRGHSVDVYTRAHDRSDDQIVQLGENARVIHLKVGEIEPIHKLVLYSRLDDVACAVESSRKRQDVRYDLIHSHYWLSSWVGRQLQVWWDVPHITMFHTLGAVKNAIGVGEDEPDLRIVTEKELVKGCDRVVAATEAEKSALISHYDGAPEAITVVPCGVNLDSFRIAEKATARQRLGFNGGNIILYVGRIEPLKGLDRLLEAVSLVDSSEGLQLVVVGGDEESQSEVESLKTLSRSLEIQDSVTFAGSVRHEDLPHYYSAADVCVVPSHYESFGMVALESLACGTPVVSTRVGGIDGIILPGLSGYVAKDNSSHGLAAGISAILSGSDAGLGHAEAIRASVAGLGWSNVADAIIDEYRELLAGRCARVG